jgi:hypothetical protein
MVRQRRGVILRKGQPIIHDMLAFRLAVSDFAGSVTERT